MYMERTNTTRYVFVTGGVLSGVGKGITAASLGAVLKARGLRVSMQKLDVYLNVDAGMLNPREHGECFVTKDGAETDLDLGHYERYLDQEFTSLNSIMSGRILLKVIEDERNGKYDGEDVQVVPHLTAAIEEFIITAGLGSDIHIVEIGGTVGDIESTAFIEAAREMSLAMPGQCVFAHVVYVPFLGTSKEFKTKPAQNSLRDLRNIGVIPHLVLARAENQPPQSAVDKIALFGGIPRQAVVRLTNAKTIYQVPLTLEEHGVDQLVLDRFGIVAEKADMRPWHEVVEDATTKRDKTVTIGIVAKYLDNEDTYYSVIEALRSAAWDQQVNLQFEWVDAEKLEKEGPKVLEKYNGILVPGGFGSRGIEGKIIAAGYAMEHNKPYLGICLGLQVAAIAAARKAGLEDANTGEVDPGTPYQVIYIMADQKGKESTGGTMRLGDYVCKLAPGSLAEKVYQASEIVERHRHRYEVNQKYRDQLEQAGLWLSGFSPDGRLVEMIEHKGSDYFIATQAHPEFLSRPNRAHPLFVGLIRAAGQQQ